MNSRSGMFLFCFIVLIILEIIKVVLTDREILDFSEILFMAFIATYISEGSKK